MKRLTAQKGIASKAQSEETGNIEARQGYEALQAITQRKIHITARTFSGARYLLRQKFANGWINNQNSGTVA